MASPLTVNAGLPAEQMFPGWIGAQIDVAMASSWVQVGPWWTLSQVILYLVVPYVPGCTCVLSHLFMFLIGDFLYFHCLL